MKRNPIPTEGLTDEQLREAAASEINQVAQLVRAAVREKARLFDPSDYLSTAAIYPDRVVLSSDRTGRQYAYPYTLNDDNTVTVGEPTEVVLNHQSVKAPLREAVASADSWFVEAQKPEEGKPPRYLVRVIKSGTSKNGVIYPADVLREAAPLFNGARVFVKSDDEHIKGGGKDVRQLVGRLVEARYVSTGKDAGEIQAVLDVLESSSVSQQLREAVQRDMTDIFGLSIDVLGPSKPNGKFREATKFTKVTSVDLIVEPGAGGQIIRFVEAHKEPDTMLREQMLAAIAAKNANKAASLQGATDEEVLTAYREAVAAEAAGNATNTVVAGVTQEQLVAHTRLVEARADAKNLVLASRLPQAAKNRLIDRFAEAAGVEDLTREKVADAIAAEEGYGNAFRESAPVTGLGAVVSALPGETRSEKVGKMLDDFFTGAPGAIRSFREAYVEITGDSNITGLIRNCDRSRLAEAAGENFREAVSAGTFDDVLGNSITRVMLADYRDNPAYTDWRDLVDIVPVRDFRTQERTRVGGYGDLPAVAENGPYNALTTPSDEKATYSVSKRGGTETLSLEAIANDDVGVIRRIPTKLSSAARRTLYKFILGFLDANPTIYDTVALFHATHGNLGTAALDNTSWAASRLRMMKQTEPGSSARLGLVPRHVYVPVELEETAFNMFVRGTNLDETFVQSHKPRVHVVPHWTDTNNWFQTADKSDIRLIELGFFGNEEPELFVQDNPTQGSLFSNDQIKYKIRHIYGGNVLDFRGFDGSIVA